MKSSRMPPMTSPRRLISLASGEAAEPGPDGPAPRLLPLGPLALEEESAGLGRAEAPEAAAAAAAAPWLPAPLPSPGGGGIAARTFSASPGQ